MANRWLGRPCLIFRPSSRTGENPPYGILGEAMETSASCEARSAPLPYPTMSEIPVHPRPRRLVDWINPTGAKKVHSLTNKVYQRKNLEMAWETVKANRGSGGVDGQSLDGFAAQLDQQLDRLQSELTEEVYLPQP